MKNHAICFSVIISTALWVSTASAGGLLGDIIENACGGCGVGQQLDEVHKNVGQPLDHVGAAAAQAQGVPVSPYCLTPQGVFVGPWLPIGIPCNVNGWQGVIVQTP